MQLMKPNLYLLDEPTNHLDIEGQEALEAQLEQVRRHLPLRHPRPLLHPHRRDALPGGAGAGWSRSTVPRPSSTGRRYPRRMDLPLDDRLRIGVQTIHRRTEPAERRRGCRRSTRCARWSSWSTAAATIRCGSATTSPSRIAIFDPLLQLAQAAVVSRRLQLRHGGLPPAAAPSHAGGQAGFDPRSPDRGPVHLRGRRRRRVSQGVRGLRRPGP